MIFGDLIYEAGSISRQDKMQARVIDDKVVAKERKKDFEISRIKRFRYRTRYFTDSGIIGSKEFVSSNSQRFKNLFYSKHDKKPGPIKGLEGIYSLKRLSESILKEDKDLFGEDKVEDLNADHSSDNSNSRSALS